MAFNKKAQDVGFEEEDDDEIDLMDLLITLRINIGFILAVLAIGLVGMAAYLQVATPTYQSEAIIRIKPAHGLGTSLLEATGATISSDKSLVTTYTDILTSRSVIEPILPDLEYEVKGKKVEQEYETVKKLVGTAPVKDSQLVIVTYSAQNPEEAQRANALLLDSFINRLTDIDRQQARVTSSFIDERAKDAKNNLKKAEDALNAFQKESKTISADDTIKDAAVKLQTVDKLKATNQMELAAAQAKSTAVAQQMSETVEPLAENTAILGLQDKLVELETQRISLTEKFTERHPKVIAINEEIAGLNDQLNQEITKVSSQQYANKNKTYQELVASKLQSDAQLAVAKANLDAIKKIEDKHNEDINQLSDDQRDYLRLMRNVNVAQEVYMMLAKRLEESKVAEVSISRDVFIIDEPSLPKKPISPNKLKMMAIAAAVALLLAMGFVIARELFNKSIRTAEDVDKYLGIPILGQVPSYEAMEQFRQLRKSQKQQSRLDRLFTSGRKLWKK